METSCQHRPFACPYSSCRPRWKWWQLGLWSASHVFSQSRPILRLSLQFPPDRHAWLALQSSWSNVFAVLLLSKLICWLYKCQVHPLTWSWTAFAPISRSPCERWQPSVQCWAEGIFPWIQDWSCSQTSAPVLWHPLKRFDSDPSVKLMTHKF